MTELYVGRRSDLANGMRLFVDLGDTEVGVLEHGGRLYAYENRCVHQGGPVCEGMILGQVEELIDADGKRRGARFSTTELHLVCPWHAVEYDLETGECVADRRRRLRRYDVRERDDGIYIEI